MEYLLSIAGYDPTAGAGVIRDIITFRKLGFYGLGIPTAITYQNTHGFLGFDAVKKESVKEQINSIMNDFKVKYVKIGMIGKASDILVESIKNYNWLVVLDPILRAKNGYPLNKIEDLQVLLEMADVITPNIPEAETLSGFKIKDENDIKKVGKILVDKYGKYVIIKGGHGSGSDYLFGDDIESYTLPKIPKTVHGTGCVYSSSLLSFLARGLKINEAFKKAREFVQNEIEKSLETGGYSLPP